MEEEKYKQLLEEIEKADALKKKKQKNTGNLTVFLLFILLVVAGYFAYLNFQKIARDTLIQVQKDKQRQAMLRKKAEAEKQKAEENRYKAQ